MRYRGLLVVAVLVAGVGAQQPIAEEVRVLADFETDAGVFELKDARIVESDELRSKALELAPETGLSLWRPGTDWSAYNVLKFEVYVPGEQAASLYVCLKDDSAPHGYFSWINRYVTIPPGRRTFEFDFSELRRGEGSPKDMLDTRPFHWNALQSLVISVRSGRMLIDDIRLEKVEPEVVEGIYAFDFGPEGSPCFRGFSPVSPETNYTDDSGFGWTRRGVFWARRRVHPPDNLVGDWVTTDNSTFSVKVPDGKYRVWMMWEDPGEWEFYQIYTYRRLLAEGTKVLEETMDGKRFLDRYFHFAEEEDLPGEDIWKKYIAWRFQPTTFDVKVSDGRLDLTIQSNGQYAATVNALVIWPQSKAREAAEFLEDLERRRRDAYYGRWVETKPKPGTLDEELASRHRDTGYVLYHRDWSRDVGFFDAPAADELLRTIEVWAARDEYEPITFTLYALGDLEGLTVTAEDFKGPGGAVLGSDAFDCRVVRYKAKRIGFGGAGQYGVVPFILAKDDSTWAKEGMSRRFWVTLHVPPDQPAGEYAGSIVLRGKGVSPARIPVKVRVLPFRLPDADMGLGMFGMGGSAPHSMYSFTEGREELEVQRKALLQAARDHGFTYCTIGGVRFNGFEDRTPRFDFSVAKSRYEEAKELGFSVIDLRIGGRGIYRQALDDDGTLAREHGFPDSDALIKAVFAGCIAQAQTEGLPDPVWIFGDEPPETLAPTIHRLHDRIRRLADARSIIAFSAGGESQQRLLDVTSICDLNVATLEHIRRARSAGNTVYLNNQGRNRWAYGLYMWKAHQAGVSAYRQFTYVGTHADPYYPLDSYEDDGGKIFPNREGDLRPTPALERIREGIDDYRYVLALSQAAESAGERGAAAQRLLEDTLAGIRFEDTRRDRRPQMTQEELSAFRRRIAEELIRLAD